MSDTDESSIGGEPRGSEAEVDDFRESLLECINGIEATGSFATGGVIDVFPIPGICVDGEPITLPLSKEAARNLASQSDKAPFGKNRETLVDETVRKTLEISAKRIGFRNPKWHDFVNELVKRVAHELGVPPGPDGLSVRAELYKNLLYEPGAMFKAHKDTEKVPGMFGTLVICLPSEHTGGTVCLQHGEDSLRLSTAESSAFNSFYLAWYADVTHEIETIQTGYRWVLTYNLINDHKGYYPMVSVLDSQMKSLVRTLSSWESLQSPPTFLVYPLNYQYTPRNLRLSSMKGDDYQHARYLADGCARHGELYLFFAQLEMHKSWPANTYDEDDPYLAQERHIHHVCNLEGTELSPVSVSTPMTFLLKPISYDGRDADTRAGGEYWGNQYADIEETYSDTVVLIVPENFLHGPLFGTTVTTQSPGHVDAVLKHLRTSPGDKTNASPQKILARLCRMILDEGYNAGEANDVYLGHVAVTATFLGDRSLFQEAQMRTRKSWQDDSWFALGGLVDLQAPSVDKNDIVTALLKCLTFRGIYQGLTHFYYGFCENNTGREDQAKAEYWTKWYSDQLIETLSSYTQCRGAEDAATVMKIAPDGRIQYTPEQRETMDEAVTSFVDKFKENKEFMNSLIIELLDELSNPNNVGLIFLRHLFGIILEVAISTLDLDLCYTYSLKKYRNLFYIVDMEKYRSLSGGLIREFYNRALEHSEDAASRLLRELPRHASKVKKNTAQEYLLPLIREFLLSVNTGSLEVQNCIQLLVKAYLAKGVGEEPTKPESWARPAEENKCFRDDCNECAELKAFLKDPGAEHKTITLSTENEKHLEWTFPFLVMEEVEDTEDRKARFTKTSKGWEARHRDWERAAGKAKQNLQDLPKDELERALGSQYDMLMALDLIKAGKGAPDEAELPARSKRPRDEDMDDTGRETALKSARRGGEEIES